MTQKALVLFRIVSVLPLVCPAAETETTWVRETVGGVRVTLVHAPQSPLQHTFAFGTPGLLGDLPSRAQFSHLVEHLIVRSTDPEELGEEGVGVNGETTALSLRLDTYAEPDRWRAALERHAEWIRIDQLPIDVLEREKERIAGEERSTVENGATHKWADVAWGQVLIGGLEHAAVHGDVAGATAEQIEQAWRNRDRQWHLVSVGPVPTDEVLEALREMLEDEGPAAPAPVGAGVDVSEAPAEFPTGQHTASWDLEARHLVCWYVVPGAGARAGLGGMLLSQALQMHLMQDAQLRELGGQVLVANDLRRGDAGALKLSLALDSDADVSKWTDALDAAVAAFATQAAPRLAALRDQWRLELQMPLDLGVMREQMAARGMASDMFEGQRVLSLVTLETLAGAPRERWSAILGEMEMDDLIELVGATLTDQPRSSLLLEPR